MIEFEPEAEFTMKARYEDAIKDVYDHSEMFDGENIKEGFEYPSSKRKHIFDFFDGCRLVISRERVAVGNILHVSASFRKGYGNDNMDFEERLELIVLRVNELRGEPLTGAVRIVSFEDIIHMVYEENQTLPLGNPILN